MICKGCQSALSVTPSIANRITTLKTSVRRIQLAKNERCFICTIVYNAIQDPESPFHAISVLPKLAEENQEPHWEIFELGFCVGVGRRPSSQHGFACKLMHKIPHSADAANRSSVLL